MALVLTLRAADGTSRTIDIDDLALPAVIGRDSEQAQVVIHDPQVSRAHARIARVNEGLVFEDLASRNGIVLNGRRVARCPLGAGDVLRIGGTELTLAEVADEPADPLVGQRMGGFEIIELLGRGRQGTVYRALQMALGREVAVKVLAEDCRKDPERVAAFLTEARRAGRLNHPNLVQVHDVVQVGDDYLLIMELMQQTVGDMLREEGQLESMHVAKVMFDVGKALGYAESQRLVHRDVKPDNILVNHEGTYKLADLGIAAAISDDGQAHQERIFGSPHYVAPEQARGGAIDGRADLYALGASAFHLLSGKPMFQGTTRQIISAQMNNPAPDLRKLVPNGSRQLIELVMRLLEKDPGRRPVDAAEVVRLAEKLINASSAVIPARRIRRMRRRRFR